MISLNCPSCSKTVHVPATEVGEAIECPHCRGVIHVPRSRGGSSGPNVGLIVGLAVGGGALVIGLFMIVIVCLAAISVLGQKASSTFTSVGGTIGGPTRMLQATDGRSFISVPSSWNTLSLNDTAKIQAGDQVQGAYLIVITEAKADFADGTTVNDYARMVNKTSMGKVADARIVSGPKELLVDGKKAVQYEYTGTLKEEMVKIHFLDTSIEGKDHFHRIFAWTVLTRFQQHRPTLDAAIDSFHEIPNVAGAPADKKLWRKR